MKKMALDWSNAHKTSTDMEPPRDEEKRTAKKHLAARHGVGS